MNADKRRLKADVNEFSQQVSSAFIGLHRRFQEFENRNAEILTSH